MILPAIDFKYWNNKNYNDSIKNKSHHQLITLIEKLYQKNNTHKQAYFCGNSQEIERLRNLNYNELEIEILNKINLIENIDNCSDEELLEIFDLIQIWGGLTGGSNFYQIKENTSQRIKYNNWIKNYKELAEISVKKEIKAYDYILSGKIKYLKMSFGSKHISFWSRKYGNNNCLIIIDNKISGVSCCRKPEKVDYKKIIEEVHAYSITNNLEPQNIEKALFSFHKNYFDNNNTYFVNTNSEQDLNHAEEIKNKLNLSEFKNSKKGIVSIDKYLFKNHFSLEKGDYIRSKSGRLFITKKYVIANKKIEKLVEKDTLINIFNKEFIVFKGNESILHFI